MENKNWRLKALIGGLVTVVLIVAVATYFDVFSNLDVKQIAQSLNKNLQANSFVGGDITLTDKTWSNMVVTPGSDFIPIYAIKFINTASAGNLTRVQVKLTASDGASFDVGANTSNVLRDINDGGITLWKNLDQGTEFGVTDQFTSVNPANYVDNAGNYRINLNLNFPQDLNDNDIYFVAIKTDEYGIIANSRFQVGINSITTSGTSPTITPVLSNQIQMDAGSGVSKVVVDGSLSSAGTTIDIYFSQSMDPNVITWADNGEGDYYANQIFWAEDPDTFTSHNFGTNALATFGQNKVANDKVTITLGASPTIADGDEIWVGFPTSSNNWLSEPITIDVTGPSLTAAYLYTDNNFDQQASQQGETLLLLFSEDIDVSTIQPMNLASRVTSSFGSFGDQASVFWVNNKMLQVILGSNAVNTVGATLTLSNQVTDLNSNPASTAPGPQIVAATVRGPTYVAMDDIDTQNWGIDGQDIYVEWGGTTYEDQTLHFNVYILPSNVLFDRDVHTKLNNDPIPINKTGFSGNNGVLNAHPSAYIETERMLKGDSRSNYSNFSTFFEFKSGELYKAYVEACNADEDQCSIPSESSSKSFIEDSDLGGDFFSQQGWQTTFVEGSVPSGGSTVSTNHKVFALKFSAPMNSSTITGSSLTLTDDAAPVTGAVSYDSEEWVAFFKINSEYGSFSAGSNLILTLLDAQDMSGNNVSFTNYYTVGSSADNTAPIVSWTEPDDETTDVSTLTDGIRIAFNEALDPTTVTSSSWAATPSVTVSTIYDPFFQGIALEFDNSALQGNTAYTITLLGNVIKDGAGNSLGDNYSFNFTTGAATTTAPQINWADFKPNGFEMQFDLPMKESTVTNSSNYTLVCGSLPVSLSAGTFNWDSYGKMLFVDGVMLTADQSCTLTINSNVKAINNIALAEASRTQTGEVHTFFGGDNYYKADTFTGNQDFQWFEFDSDTYDTQNMSKDKNLMFFNPMNFSPGNRVAGETTKAYIEFFVTKEVENSEKLEFTFPNGFGLDNVVVDSNDPLNKNLVQWDPITYDGEDYFGGKVTVSNTVIDKVQRTVRFTLKVDYDNDGVGDANAKFGTKGAQIKLSIAGLVNPATAASYDSTNDKGGYEITVKTLDSADKDNEGPFYFPAYNVSEGGDGSVTLTIQDESEDGISGVKVFCDSWTVGFNEFTTNGSGQIIFSNIPINDWGTDVNCWLDGMNVPNGYLPTWESRNFHLTEEVPTASDSITLQSADNQINVVINHSGITDGTTKVDVGCGNMNGWYSKSITLEADGGTNATVYVGETGNYNCSVNKNFNSESGAIDNTDMTMPPPQNVNVTGESTPTATFIISVPSKTITGRVIDQSGNGVSGAKIMINADFQFNDKGFGTQTQADKNGYYSVRVDEGNYIMEFKIKSSFGGVIKKVNLIASDTSKTVNVTLKKPDASISGQVTNGSGGIQYASTSCHTDDFSENASADTDSSGNYTIKVNAGTWTCQAFARNVGEVPAAIGVDVTSFTVNGDVTGKNFTYDSTSFANITGIFKDNSGSAISNAWCWADKINNTTKEHMGFGNGDDTDSTGAFSIQAIKNSEDERYQVRCSNWEKGEMVLSNSTNISSGNVNLGIKSMPELYNVTISISGAPTTLDRAFIDLHNDTLDTMNWTDVQLTSGSGSNIIKLAAGDYTLRTYIQGLGETNQSFTVAGTRTVTLDFSTVTTTNWSVTVINASNDDPLRDVYVDFFDPATGRYTNCITDSDGECTATGIAGRYEVKAELEDYITEIQSITSSTASVAFELTAADSTITGAVKSSNVGVPYAFVNCLTTDNKFTGTMADGNGNYSLNVADNTVCSNISAFGPDGKSGTISSVSAGAASQDVSLSSNRNFNFKDPAVAKLDATKQAVITEKMGEANIPQGAFGQSTDVSLTLQQTGAVPKGGTTSTLGDLGVDFKATDSGGNQITRFSSSIDIAVKYDKSEVESFLDDGLITVNNLNAPLGYVDNGSLKVLEGSSIQVRVQEDTGDSYSTLTDGITDFIDNYATYSGYNDYEISYKGKTDHFTVFAPVVSGTGDATAPSAPSTLTATAGSSQVVLNWADNSEDDLLEYEIYRSTSSTVTISDANQINLTSVTSSAYTDSTVSNGTRYYYKVTAVDTAGNESSGSSTVNATPGSSSSNSTGGSSFTKNVNMDTIDDNVVDSSDDTHESADEEDEDISDTAVVEDEGQEDETSTTIAKGKDYSDHWANEHIQELYDREIVSGCDSESNYCPEANITRAELLKIAMDIYGIKKSYALENPFKDLSNEHWAYDYILTAYYSDVIGGYKDGTFRADNEINRAEALKVLFEAALINLDEQETNNPFLDIDVSEWYAKYVLKAYASAIVEGYLGEDGRYFKPDKPISRAEVAKIALLIEDLKEAVN